MVKYVIATKRRTCDDPLETKQKTNITRKLFAKAPLRNKGVFSTPKTGKEVK